MKRIWVNGTFDVLHLGHVKLLNYASQFGVLRVGIDTDDRVRSKKGLDRPYNTFYDRREMLLALSSVDSVVGFGSDEELIEKIKEWGPDIMVIGDDYTYEQIIGKEYIPEIKLFKKISGFSTTNILKNKK